MKYIEKQLSLLDIEDMLLLQDEVLNTIKDKDTFQADSREDLEEFVTKGFGIGMYAGEKLIAYQVLKNPASEDSLIMYLPFYIPKDLRVFHFETTIVHPYHRGQGFQKKMKNISLEILKSEDRADIICNTIHPFNYPSVKSSLATGAKIAGLKTFYGGKIRFIFFTPIGNRLFFSYDEKSVEIDLRDYSKILEMIEKGYVGHTIKENSILLSKINFNNQ